MDDITTLSLTIFDSLKKGVAIFKEGKAYALNAEFKKLFRLNKKNNRDFFQILQSREEIILSPVNSEKNTEADPLRAIIAQKVFKNELWQVTDKKLAECWYGNFSARTVNTDVHTYYVLYVDDVSESHLVKARLKSETTSFYELLDALPVMISIYNPQQNDFFLNKAVYEITGWTEEDARNKNIMELAYPEKEYRDRISEYMRDLKPGFLDITMKTKGGNNIITSWANVRLSDGRQVGIGIDINKQREAEKKLKDSEEKFRNLADNISQLTWITNEKGEVIWYNKRWFDFTGQTEDKNGKTFLNLVHPSYRVQVEAYFKECIQKEKIWEDSFPLKAKNNEYRWFLSRALPIRDENNKIKKWFGTNTDITELKQLQDKLIIANEKAENAIIMQKTFIQNISHEVRTPMNSILGFAELLQNSHFEPEEKEYLDSISYNGKQLLNLINDIIDFSRLDSKELKLSKDEVKLNKVFLELENQFEALIHHFKKENIELKIDIREKDKVIYADHHRLQQVMSNLLSNAVKYTEKGFVEIGYEILIEENKILFFVKDSGIGIDSKFKSLIFKRFHQTDKKQLHGTGLGLAICKHLVNLFGGEIWFESQKDKGSSFYFTYPLKEVSAVSEKISAQADNINTSQPELEGKTILVAEDDEYSFRLLEALLTPTNAKILHASNGKEAVELFRKNPIDIVFLDIRLPELDGYEVLDIIKEENKNIPVIAQTAYAMPEDKTKSHTRGFDFHTTKPITLKNLYTILNTFLDLRNRKLA